MCIFCAACVGRVEEIGLLHTHPTTMLQLLPLTALALSANRLVLDPLSLLNDKEGQKTLLRSYTPLPGCEMATLAMS